jgi:hypothetical protein
VHYVLLNVLIVCHLLSIILQYYHHHHLNNIFHRLNKQQSLYFVCRNCFYFTSVYAPNYKCSFRASCNKTFIVWWKKLHRLHFFLCTLIVSIILPYSSHIKARLSSLPDRIYFPLGMSGLPKISLCPVKVAITQDWAFTQIVD